MDSAFVIRNLDVFYGDKQALFAVDLDIPPRAVTAMIGPSGCGKSTFIRCLNRMNDLIPSFRVLGSILHEGTDLLGRQVDVIDVRRRIGMVFQKPNPFPKSIYENIAYGLRINGTSQREVLDGAVEGELEEGRIVGRGERPALRLRPFAFRRPAAAPLHRPRHRHPPPR